MSPLILTVETALLERLGPFQGYTLAVERYLPALLDPAGHTYLPRAEAERDPTHKQLIPYVILRCGDTVLAYVRGAGSGEARLAALRSIGLGGHVEIKDQARGSAYEEGVRREVAEEVEIEPPLRERIVALINDDANDVGRVHLGVVHLWDLPTPTARPRETAIAEARFTPIAELRRHPEGLETWSQIALQVLADSRIIAPEDPSDC